MSERVQVTIDNAIATVRLSRPDKLNALDADMFDALIAAGERLQADNSVRAIRILRWARLQLDDGETRAHAEDARPR